MNDSAIPTSIDVLDHAESACLLLDAEGNCRYVNRAAEKMLQKPCDSLLGSPLAAMFALVAPGQMLEPLHRALAAAKSIRCEIVLLGSKRHDGKQRFEFEIAPTAPGARLLIARAMEQQQPTEVGDDLEGPGWRRIIDQVQWGIAMSGADERTLRYVNPAFATMHGYTPDELVGTPIAEMFAPHLRAEVPALFEMIHRSGHHRFESQHIRKDGHVFPVLIDATAVKNSDGEVTSRIVNVQDISAQIAAREELRVRKEFFQRTFTDAPVGMAIADLNGRYLCANDAMCRMMGYSEEELKRMTYRDITHPDDVARNDALRNDLLDQKTESFEMEKRYIRKDGQAIWALMVVSSITGPDGKAIVTVGQMLDIDRLKRTEISLQESHDFFNTIINTAPVRVFWKDRDLRFLGCNLAFARDAGTNNPDDLIGKDDYQTPWSKQADNYRRDDLLVMSSGEAKLAYEVQQTRTDGRTLWLSTSKAPLKNRNNETIGVLGIYQDITQTKRHEQEIIRSREQIRALAAYHERILEEERKHISREIHDELGQQLSALKLDIALLRLNHGNARDIADLVQRMRQTVDSSINVVRQIAGNLRPAAIDLGIVAAIEWLAQEFTSRWDIDCEVDAKDGDISLGQTQATVVFRIVQESLTNAARHSRARHVSVTMCRFGDLFYLSIRDDGQGFNVERASASGHYGLLGMRERVHTLGGAIDIESTPDTGTVIRITFPLEQT